MDDKELERKAKKREADKRYREKNKDKIKEKAREAGKKYDKSTYKVEIKFYSDDEDIIEYVKSQPDKSEYIRGLIRADIKKDT